MKIIPADEVEQRLRRVSQLRAMILTLRRGALEAWTRGESPVRPRIDVRSDLEYWEKELAKLQCRDDGEGT